MRLSRPVDFLHLPVPRARDDAPHFEPLRGLDHAATTQLFLGVVHLTDGIDGTRRRMAAAARAVPRFGIATECGLGRRPSATVPALLQLHALASSN